MPQALMPCRVNFGARVRPPLALAHLLLEVKTALVCMIGSMTVSNS